ncbi:MAG: KH domain-containing protein, partial [SAR202 cluster bacterium]|nr:KH domain-containing protein [SAR202 cluster bacterium]
LLSLMHVKAEAAEGSSPGESPDTPVLQVTGEDAGLLIGRGGETLRALQLLTNLIATKSAPNRAHIIVDVERYRERRAEALRRLARRIADRVASSRRPFTLEPMSPYERRLIHITLAEDPRVTTESVGEGDDRKVSVRPKQSQGNPAPRPPKQENGAPWGRSAGGGRYRPMPGPDQDDAPGP